MFKFAVLLLHYFFDAVDFHLTDIHLVLVLHDLDLGLLVYFFLSYSHAVQLHTHILDLLGLGMVNIGTTANILVALFNFLLCRLVLLGNIALTLLSFSQLNFDIAK